MANVISLALIEAAVQRVPGSERPALQAFLSATRAAVAHGASEPQGLFLAILAQPGASTSMKLCAGFVNHHCRQALSCGTAEIADVLLSRLQALQQLAQLPLQAPVPASNPWPSMTTFSSPVLMPDQVDGRFVQLAHEVMLGRGCHAHELVRWRVALASGEITREGLLAVLLREAVDTAERDAARAADREVFFHVMGTGQKVSWADWQARAAQRPSAPAPPTAPQRFFIRSPPRVLISAITSLYAGGKHIERFMVNLVNQSCFRDHVELIIIDAHSPDGERAVIERFQRDRPNIRYVRINHRIGIYDAWNLAVSMARGDYLTSTNVDDLRRRDSLEQQAAVLDNMPFVDVVYQDFYYTLDPIMSFEEAAAFGYRSDLPLVTPQGLMTLNAPHNAPMWRRRLHDELGPFDNGLVSAGDYDFWMRCVIAGKAFFKLNDAHVVYYQNPEGLSTRPGSKGHTETRAIHKRYGRSLVSENLVMTDEAFQAAHLSDLLSGASAGTDDRHSLLHRALRAAAEAAQ